MVTDAQVRKLMEEIARHGQLSLAAMKSGMDRKTARKYRAAGKLPSELVEERRWRTRRDPFARVWPLVAALLSAAPELEAKTIFDHLCRKNPGEFEEGQLRTLQRRVRQWRAEEGPPKEVFFPQRHRPGEAAQTDFTWASELGVTISGEPFEHMLCHFVLPYSNWSWATVCHSESLLALRSGVQAAVFRLGRVPEYHQTDNSTAATHSLGSGKREFNEEYAALMRHFGMTPRTIGVGKKEQNGDVESANGALKRRLKQHLLLRDSHDFESVKAYTSWLHSVLEQANGLRQRRLAEDLAAMRPLSVKRLPEYRTEKVKVTSYSTIRVARNAYSVPSRLIGEHVQVRVFDERLEVHYAGKRQARIARLRGSDKHRIDYRHIIWWLVQKPGAFERYRYREDLFPTVAFRRAYDALVAHSATKRQADIEYLRVLHLAASTMESEVEAALCLLEAEGQPPCSDTVKSLVDSPPARAAVDMEVMEVDLGAYDALLAEGVAA